MANPKQKQCQAFAKSSKTQCTKGPMPGSRYCFWHQSWGVNIIGSIAISIIMLIAGAFLGPVAADIYHSHFPSQETIALSNLGEKVADIDKSSEERDRLQTQKLDKVLASQGNEKAKEEYLAAYKELIKLYAEKMVKEPDNEYLKKQRESLKKIEQISAEYANRCELQWSPAVHYIVSLFDKEFQKWDQKGCLKGIETNEIPVVVAEKIHASGFLRSYLFVDGSILRIHQVSGRVEAGQLQRKFEITVFFDTLGRLRKYLIDFDFIFDRFDYGGHLGDFEIDRYSSSGAPMKDKGFTDELPKLIQRVVNYAIVQSGVEIK